MTAAEQPTQDPAFADIPPAAGLYAGFTGFRTDARTVLYTREILFRGTYALAIVGGQINFGGLRPGYDLYVRDTARDYFRRLWHGEHLRENAIRSAQSYDDRARVDALTRSQLPAALAWIGHRYERAKLSEPRDFRTMQRAEAVLEHLYRRFEEAEPGEEFDPGQFFRTGQNLLRMFRRLEQVADW